MACYATSPTASFLSAHRKFSWLKAAMHVSNEVVKNVRVGSLIISLSRLAKSPEEINYRKKCSPLRGQLSRTDRKGDGKLGYNFTASLFIFGLHSENHEKPLLQSSSTDQEHAAGNLARIDPHDGGVAEKPRKWKPATTRGYLPWAVA